MSSKRAAPKSEVEELHGELASALVTAIKDGKASAALLQVARQFVRDQGVTCSPIHAEEGTVEGLVDDLEELEAADFPKFSQ